MKTLLVIWSLFCVGLESHLYASLIEAVADQAIASEFATKAKKVISLLEEKNVSLPNEALSTLRLLSKNIKVSVEDHVFIFDPTSNKQVEVDAKNIPSLTQIIVNESRWREMKLYENEKLFLVLHELLGLIGLDHKFEISTKVFGKMLITPVEWSERLVNELNAVSMDTWSAGDFNVSFTTLLCRNHISTQYFCKLYVELKERTNVGSNQNYNYKIQQPSFTMSISNFDIGSYSNFYAKCRFPQFKTLEEISHFKDGDLAIHDIFHDAISNCIEILENKVRRIKGTPIVPPKKAKRRAL